RIWGFELAATNAGLVDALNIWARFVYAPLLEDRKQQIMEGSSSAAGAEAISRVHKELRRLGGIKPPREFVLMDRAAIGLGAVFMHLKAEINWYQLFHDLIADFDTERLAERQREALQKVGLGEEVPG